MKKRDRHDPWAGSKPTPQRIKRAVGIADVFWHECDLAEVRRLQAAITEAMNSAQEGEGYTTAGRLVALAAVVAGVLSDDNLVPRHSIAQLTLWAYATGVLAGGFLVNDNDPTTHTVH